jgi:ADP-ribose pyrophosphatase
MNGTREARVRAHRRVYDGKVLSLDVDEVEEPGGVAATREVVRHRGSVAVLAVHDDGRIVLVSQYRYPAGQTLWELPAGRLDAGESPEAAAGRELEEEVGLRPSALEALATYFTTPGFCDETMHLFRGTGLLPVAARPEPDERIEVRSVTLERARQMVESGEVREGKTMIAILLETERRGAESRNPRS